MTLTITPPWCCKEGERLRMHICPSCAEACAGYQAAMAPVTPIDTSARHVALSAEQQDAIARRIVGDDPVSLVTAQRIVQETLAVLGASPAPAGWRPIETAPKDGRPIRLGYMEDGEITQTADMQWSHIQRNGLFPGTVGMWVCPGGNFTWNPEPAEFGPTHWQPLPPPPGTEGCA